MMQKISVGERPIDSDYLFIGNDGMRFDMTDSGGLLIVRMRCPNNQEVESFKSNMRLRFRVVDGIIFILIQINNSWSDAPYYRYLDGDLTCLPTIKGSRGLAVHAIMSDGNTGIVVAQKLIGFSPEGSKELIKAIVNQPQIQDYYDRLARIMYMYSSDDLAKDSISLF